MYYIFGIVATCIGSFGYESYDIHLIGFSGEVTYLLRQIVGIFFRVCTLCNAEVVAPKTFRDYRTQSIVVNIIAVASVLFVFDTVLYEIDVKFRFGVVLLEASRYLYLDIQATSLHITYLPNYFVISER